MRALFIGGPWDGRLVEHNLMSATFHVAERIAPRVSYQPEEQPSFQPPRDVTYVRVPLLGTDFMVEQQLYERGLHFGKGHHPAEVVIDLLKQGYRRPSSIYGDV